MVRGVLVTIWFGLLLSLFVLLWVNSPQAVNGAHGNARHELLVANRSALRSTINSHRGVETTILQEETTKKSTDVGQQEERGGKRKKQDDDEEGHGHRHGHEEEESDEEDEEEEDQEGYTMGLAMIGGILLIMGLFCLVHNNDMDIRKTTWVVISHTISIFCGVMIFSWVNEFFDKFIFLKINDRNFELKRYVNKAWSAVFYIIFVLSLSLKAGVFHPHAFRQGILKHGFVKAVTVNAMSTSIIWAHVVGFAMTYGWGMTQNSDQRDYKDSPLKSAKIIPAVISLFFLYLWAAYILRSLLKVLFIEAWKPGDRVILHGMTKDQESHLNGECGELLAFKKGKWTVLLDGPEKKEVQVFYSKLGVEVAAKQHIETKEFDNEEEEKKNRFKEDMKIQLHEMIGGNYVNEERGATIDIPLGENKKRPERLERVALISTLKHDAWSWCKCKGRCFMPTWAKVQYHGEIGTVRVSDLKSAGGQVYCDRSISSKSLRISSAPKKITSGEALLNKEEEEEDDFGGKEHDKMIEIWEEKIEEGEDDIYAIVTAFVVIQSLRFAVGGVLPNARGKERRPHGEHGEDTFFTHDLSQVFWMYFWSVLMLSSVGIEDAAEQMLETKRYEEISTAVANCMKSCLGKWPILLWTLRSSRKIFWRLTEVFTNVGIMGCSWGIICATQWWLARQTSWTFKDRSIVSVYLAIIVSLCCMPFIWVMDKLADSATNGNKLRKIQRGTGFLIGFTWEAVFDDSMDAIGETLVHDEESIWNPTLKAILGLACLALIIPAWCLYIIPMVEEDGYKLGFIARRLHHRIQYTLQEFVRDEGDTTGKHHEAQCKHLKYYARKLRQIEESINFYIGIAYEEVGLNAVDEDELDRLCEEELEQVEDSGASSEEEEDIPLPECLGRCAQHTLVD